MAVAIAQWFIGPGQYFLIQQAQGSSGTTPLPADVVGTITAVGPPVANGFSQYGPHHC